MKIKTKLLIWLILMAIVDLIIPLPLSALFLLYVLFNKPPWFREWVRDIYDLKKS